MDTGDDVMDDIIHEQFAMLSMYGPSCAVIIEDVNLENCTSGCLASHVTGLLLIPGRCEPPSGAEPGCKKKYTSDPPPPGGLMCIF